MKGGLGVESDTVAQTHFFRTAVLVAVLLLAKFVAYGWLVTPLWDVPDESGHYSYVEDIAGGNFPVLGRSLMHDDVMHSWKGAHAKPALNWIAQHPPLFYTLDAPVIMVARAMGANFDQQVRAARLPAALFGALTILGLALFLAKATGNAELGLGGAIFFAATPMFTHLSTGVSHDTMVACTAAWAAYWCVCWLESGRFRHALYAGVLAGLCAATKLTGLAMAVPLFALMAVRLWQHRNQPGEQRWLRRATLLWMITFVPICIWMARNLALFGQPFPDASIIYGQATVPIGFFNYLHDFPFWQHTLLNFIALVGWNGSDHGALKWLHATGWMARYFLTVIAAGGLLAIFKPALRHLDERVHWVVHLAGMALLAYGFVLWPLNDMATRICLLLLVVFLCTLAYNANGWLHGDRTGWLLATSAACVLFFALVYYEHLWASFGGTMRATHGRYLYPVAPFLLLVLFHPFRSVVASRMLLCAAVLAMVLADGFFLHDVFAMYGQL